MVKRSREDSDALSSPTSTSPTSSLTAIENTEDLEEQPPKYAQLDESAAGSDASGVMFCSLPPHRQALTFPSYDAYEIHYAKAHVNRCSACGKNFPTGHFLGLHLAENHDPLNEVRKAKGEKIVGLLVGFPDQGRLLTSMGQYACLVEDCDRTCSSPQKRRRHLIDKHMFPKDYDIYVINDGIDKRSSMLRTRGHRRRSSATFPGFQREQRARRHSNANALASNPGPIPTPQGHSSDKEPGPPGHGDDDQTADSIHDNAVDDNSGAGRSTITAPEQEAPVGKAKVDEDMLSLTNSMSALRFVPTSVRLARAKKNG